jgi:hypothetical protein
MEQAIQNFFARGGTVTKCPTRKAKGSKQTFTSKHLGRTCTTDDRIPGWRMPKNK